MKTKIYWIIQHNHRAAHDLRFRARCWWLSQQVSILGWRLRLEDLLPNLVPKKGTHVYTGAV